MNLNELIKPIWEHWSKIDSADKEHTYCNMFINSVMLTQDYYAFQGKTTNGIISIMEFEKFTWKKIDPKDWKQDSIVIAGLQDEPHGHVNILIAGEFIESGKWKKKVPLCANVGKDVFWGKGVNYSFGKLEPTYYQFQLTNLKT